MAKRTKSTSSHTSLRLPADLLDGVNRIAADSGWSNARVIAHLATIGRLVINDSPAAVAIARETLARAVKIHQVELENERRLAAARKELRSPGAAPGWRAAVKAVTGRAPRKSAAKPAQAPAAAKP